ncbi:hydrogenase subunit MbhD domain-containing protein [Meridianimarinicoccus sp. RP-17]|uniref:hydrogenase subunit MbhD domain-containing protein n=1 Tax=Meridianimarinicoccus zhengii TaxID=2056810 RepID=UPI001C9B9F17|nr:hydrogenase subunit MbhD domain-containing protein [Phycocomes zhengii]
MSPPDPYLLLDLGLAATILVLALAALRQRDSFTMAVVFILFGLLVALAWVRLDAPDVALAEAAIGAGVTGALLLRTLRHVGGERRDPAPVPRVVAGMLGLSVAGFATLGGLALMATPRHGTGLIPAVAARMDQSGVEHPVTAVLLNFRAYDTLLEVVVVLAAVMAVWAIDRTIDRAAAPLPYLPGVALRGPIAGAYLRLVLPALALIGAYLVWIGAYSPGGAFQGGAVLAAAGVLSALARGGRWPRTAATMPLLRGSLVLGVVVFTGVGIWAAVAGGGVLHYPPAQAKPLILLIEASVALSIAATLTALFLGHMPQPAARIALRKGTTNDT